MESTALFITILLTLLYMYDALRIGHLYGGSGFGAIGYMKAAYMSGSQGPKMNALIISSEICISICFLYGNNNLISDCR